MEHSTSDLKGELIQNLNSIIIYIIYLKSIRSKTTMDPSYFHCMKKFKQFFKSFLTEESLIGLEQYEGE